MASFNFNAAIHKIVTGAIDLDTDSFKMMLVTTDLSSTTTPKDTYDFRNDVTGVEHAATGGYTAGGVACTLTVAAVDAANDDVEVTCGVVNFGSNTTITARGAVIYKSRGGADTADELLCFIDFGANVSSTNGSFTVTPSGSLKFQN